MKTVQLEKLLTAFLLKRFSKSKRIVELGDAHKLIILRDAVGA